MRHGKGVVVSEKQTNSSLTAFWLSAWLGTVLAEGIWGLWLAGPTGFARGCWFAGIIAIPVFAVVAVLTWCLWLSKYRILAAFVAGGATGGVLGGAALSRSWMSFAIPGVAGALGGVLGGGLHWLGTSARMPETETKRNAWQFSMRDLFLRLTVLALLLAALATVQKARQTATLESRAQSCRRNLEKIASGLKSYHAAHGRLPPVQIVDNQGNPTMSWRVHIRGQWAPATDFIGQIDISRPWDDAKNDAFFRNRWSSSTRCPGLHSSTPKEWTHYVAVTGPGTHWTESGSLEKDTQNTVILVIEWPPSDIHWAEPRDVTADEFLAWFESKDRQPRRVHRHGLHYIDATGEVLVLPWDIKANELRKLLTPDPPSTAHHKDPEQPRL